MRAQVEKYTGQLLRDRSAVPGRIGFAVLDDGTIEGGAPDLSGLAADVLWRLSCLGVVVAVPSLPFADFLVRRAPAGASCLVPSDAETRTFLHDIPFSPRADLRADPAETAAGMLGNRKGAILEGLGIAAVGALTTEQAYIHYSSVFHAVYVQYLADALRYGFKVPGEEEAFRRFRREHLRAPTADGIPFRDGPLEDPAEILAEIRAVGGYTVERGLVDSFFGNISLRAGGMIFISRTGASLDELAGCIDPVPDDSSSTAGITASSELPAHRRIYESTGARAILHGHPKFAVAMSMLCEGMLGDAPIVGGETGAGGLAEQIAPAIGRSGKAIVHGHGVFTVGRNTLGEAFRAMAEVENRCREEYFRRLDARSAPAPGQSKSE